MDKTAGVFDPNNFDILNLITTSGTLSTNDASALSDYLHHHAESGHITIDGHLYTWVNFDGLKAVLNVLQSYLVTWFNPGDGRFDPHPAERIAIYCHLDKNTLGVLLINNDSKGNVGTSFKLDALKAAGPTGVTYDFGINGTLSIMLDPSGNGYAAWNGGVDGANGRGDFAKTYQCDGTHNYTGPERQ